MKKSTQLILDAVIVAITAAGFKADRWSNYVKESKGEKRRFKISKTSVRYEAKMSSGWMRLRSGYIKDLSVVDGKVKGLRV